MFFFKPKHRYYDLFGDSRVLVCENNKRRLPFKCKPVSEKTSFQDFQLIVACLGDYGHGTVWVLRGDDNKASDVVSYLHETGVIRLAKPHDLWMSETEENEKLLRDAYVVNDAGWFALRLALK